MSPLEWLAGQPIANDNLQEEERRKFKQTPMQRDSFADGDCCTNSEEWPSILRMFREPFYDPREI